MSSNRYIVPLNITAESYELTYRGAAKVVVARDIDGRTIQLPASSLRPFVTREGIQGVFVIRVDNNNKLIDISRKNG